MYICNNCDNVFHDTETLQEPLDDDFNGQRSFIGYDVCPECRSSDIEEMNRCACGELKRKSDEYCINCTDITSKIVQCAISEIIEFIPKLTRSKAREMLKDYVEENL